MSSSLIIWDTSLSQHCIYRTAGPHLKNSSLHHSFQECKCDVNQGSRVLIS